MRLNRDNHPQIALEDIDDVYGFVAHHVLRAPGVPVIHDPEEAEELIHEGVTILFELHDRFEPHRTGYAKPGRFSGYAAWALPKRLQNAWRRMHPEHLTRKRPDGRRTVEYGQRPLSVDFYADERAPKGEVRRALLETQGWTVATSCLPGQPTVDRIDQAVVTATPSAPHASAVVYHLACGARTDTEIAEQLGLARIDVTRTRQMVGVALQQHQQAA